VSAYFSVDVEDCRRRNHKFKITGSDKTPLKRNLVCATCSERTGKSAYAAFGDETKSFGIWRHIAHVESEKFTDDELTKGESS
jgi:hypothetical protein